MAGSLIHMLPVAACSFIALLLSDILKIEPIYDTLLERFVEKSGDSLPMQEKGGLLEFPVEFGSKASGKLVSEIEWPDGSLIVGLRRGVKEFVPRGNTKIMSGDYLVILSPQEDGDSVLSRVKLLCHADSK